MTLRVLPLCLAAFIASLSSAAVADDVVVDLAPGDRLIVNGVLQIGDDASATCSSAADEGTLRWQSGALQVCDGVAWNAVAAPRDGVNQSAAGASCKDILAAFPGSPDGDYWLDPDGGTTANAFQVFCDMTTHGGGWTLVLNLETSDADRRDYVDTGYWEGAAPIGAIGAKFTADYKSGSFANSNADEIMMRGHDNGTVLGTATYTLLPAYAGSSLQTLFTTLTDTTVTGTRTANSGSVGTNGRARNSGDAFIDNPHPMVVNSAYSIGTASNQTRLGTRYGSGFTPNLCLTIQCGPAGSNYGGWGGRHLSGGWGADYEGAAVHGYCAAEGGFGTNGTVFGGGDDAFNGVPGVCDFAGHDVDMSVFIR